MGATLTFRHGVHPPELKELTAALPVRRMPFPEEVVLPLRQHTGAPAQAIVAVGDRVDRGDKIAAADGWVSVPVHASASGTVTAIDLYPHPDGSYAEAICIAVDPFSPQAIRPRLVPRWQDLDPREIVAAVQEAGLVGLGGAAFPTHVKLSPPDDVKIDVLLLNGCECEPYLTTDHRTMVDYPERVVAGARIMMRSLGVERCIIGVEKNKPDAIDALRAHLPGDVQIDVLALTVKYPQGAEKMLIKAVLDRDVPTGGLPMNVGAVVQNVASVATIAEVFETGLPLVERIVSVTGKGVVNPGNLIVPVGTTLRALIDACGGLRPDAREVVAGGPMMGIAQRTLDAPVLKGTSGIVVLSADECRRQESHPCIGCGTCVDACPVYLNPRILGALAKKARYEEMEEHHLADCMLCGCCSYACPSNIPLSQLFQLSKKGLQKRKVAT